MAQRTLLIAGNWKMHKTAAEASQTASRLVELLAAAPVNVEVMVAPPFTALDAVAKALSGTKVALGAQNLHWEPQGAYTGEISAPMLKAAGCRYVIVGHSERRQYFGEDDQMINRKIKAALSEGLSPIMCIGETEQQRDQGQTVSVLDKQVTNGLKDIVSDDLARVTLAYEPVWAIGTGRTATGDQVQEVHGWLRTKLAADFGELAAATIRILYGGSVKPENVAELMAKQDVDGALVGGASLDPETFNRLIRQAVTEAGQTD